MSEPTLSPGSQTSAEKPAVSEETKTVSPEVTATSPQLRPAETPASSPSEKTKSAKPKEGKPVTKNKKNFSNETVLSRARRMMRSQLNPVAQALGLEKYEEEAFKKKLEELRKAKEDGMSDIDRSAKRTKELEDRVVALSAELNQAKTEGNKLKKELGIAQKEVDRTKTDFEIRDLASRAGIVDLDYGLHLLKGHIKNLAPGEQVDAEKIKGFFEGLKKDPAKRALFAEVQVPAGPKSLAESQPVVPGQQAQPPVVPPQGAPKPGENAGAGKEEPNTLEMDKRDFNRYSREKYGYSPGMA